MVRTNMARAASVSLLCCFILVCYFTWPSWAGRAVQGRPIKTPAYSVTSLGTLPACQSSVALGINKNGHVVGRSGAAQSGGRAFLWRDGRMEDLGTLPGGDYSQAMDINDSGEVVGWSNTGVTVLAFYWYRGQMRSLGTLPGDTSSQAIGINNRGLVVGYSSGASRTRPFLWSERTGMIDLRAIFGGEAGIARAINNLGLLIGSSVKNGLKRGLFSDGVSGEDLSDVESLALGLNDVGEVVGRLGGRTNGHAFRWKQREGIKDLGTLAGHHFSEALHINNGGEVVGSSRGEGGNRAFIWTKKDGMRDLNDLIPDIRGVVLTVASRINEKGQVIAYNDNLVAPTLAFLLTPGNGASSVTNVQEGANAPAAGHEHHHGEATPVRTP